MVLYFGPLIFVVLPEYSLFIKADSLDEPFSNIAPVYIEKVEELIQGQKQQKGIIVSDHLYEAIIEVADDLFLLKDGYTFPIESKDDLVHRGYLLR